MRASFTDRINLLREFLTLGFLGTAAAVVGIASGLNSMFGSSSQPSAPTSGAAPSYYQPTGQPQADQSWLNAMNQINSGVNAQSGMVQPQLNNAYQNMTNVNPSGYVNAGNQAGSQYAQQAQLAAMYQQMMQGQAGTSAGAQQTLMGQGNQQYGTGSGQQALGQSIYGNAAPLTAQGNQQFGSGQGMQQTGANWMQTAYPAMAAGNQQIASGQGQQYMGQNMQGQAQGQMTAGQGMQNAAMGQQAIGQGMYGNAQPLMGAGNQMWNTVQNPQSGLYNQMLQQTQDTSNAATSMRGIGMSPEAAGIENQAVNQFNNAWNNNFVQNQASGLNAMSGAYNAGAGQLAAGTSAYGAGTSAYGAGTGAYNAGANAYGAGTSAYGAGTSAVGQGANLYNTAGNQMSTGAQVYGAGTSAVGQGGNLYNAAANQYGAGTSAFGAGTQAGQAGTNAYNAAGNQGQLTGANLQSASNYGGQIPGYTLNSGATPFNTAQTAYGAPITATNQYTGAMNQGVYQPYGGIQTSMMPYMNYGMNSANNAFGTGAAQQTFNANQQAAGMNGLTQGLNQLSNNQPSWMSGMFGGGSSYVDPNSSAGYMGSSSGNNNYGYSLPSYS